MALEQGPHHRALSHTPFLREDFLYDQEGEMGGATIIGEKLDVGIKIDPTCQELGAGKADTVDI